MENKYFDSIEKAGSRKILIVIIVVLLVGNLFFAFKYFIVNKKFNENKIVLNSLNEKSSKIKEFNKLFVSEVLNASGEISFETRLKLENSVRDLKDEEILAQWQKFTESKTEEEAQNEVKTLLGLLASKL